MGTPTRAAAPSPSEDPGPTADPAKGGLVGPKMSLIQPTLQPLHDPSPVNDGLTRRLEFMEDWEEDGRELIPHPELAEARLQLPGLASRWQWHLVIDRRHRVVREGLPDRLGRRISPRIGLADHLQMRPDTVDQLPDLFVGCHAGLPEPPPVQHRRNEVGQAMVVAHDAALGGVRYAQQNVVVFSNPRPRARESGLEPGLDAAVLQRVDQGEDRRFPKVGIPQQRMQSRDRRMGAFVQHEALVEVPGLGAEPVRIHRNPTIAVGVAPTRTRRAFDQPQVGFPGHQTG